MAEHHTRGSGPDHHYAPDPQLVRPFLPDIADMHPPVVPTEPPPAVVGRAAVPSPVRLQMTGFQDDIAALLTDLDRFWRLEDVSDPISYIGRRVLVTATVFRRFPLAAGGELR